MARSYNKQFRVSAAKWPPVKSLSFSPARNSTSLLLE
jgi:hypothetical protein